MSDIPIDAPEHCPGTQSDSAGKSSACAGCPNQSMCASGQAKLPLTEREPETIAAIKKRLGRVRHRILILSGKGGVGKSSISVCLARGLSRHPRSTSTDHSMDVVENFRVGLLDLDLCGPSIPCMLGCMEARVHQSQSGWSPVFVSDNLSLMSVGFLLPGPDHPVIWRGPRKNVLIRQLLSEVCWTEAVTDDPVDSVADDLDFLLVDTPPGTSDEHLSAVQYLQAAQCLDGALIVTTPQEVALSDVRKEINFCQKLSIPILGIVENMTEFICPSCGHVGPVFPPTTGGAASLCSNVSNVPNAGDTRTEVDARSTIPLLGRLPLDPRLARALDEGLCPFEVADSNEAVHDELSTDHPNNTLKCTDAILVAYNQLIDRLLCRLQQVASNGQSDADRNQKLLAMDAESDEPPIAAT